MPKRTSTTSENENVCKKPKVNGHWSMGLLNTLKDPKYKVKSDDLVTVIKDMYPKAEYHYLVLPHEEISSLKVVNKNHLALLKHMEEVAEEIISKEQHKGKTFKIGYHAEPSMVRLHLHVISDDMNSLCLKTKKHWNSFTSNFFLKSRDVIKSLEENGKLILPSKDECKELINTPLKCHKCDYKPKHLPDLKKHILSHKN